VAVLLADLGLSVVVLGVTIVLGRLSWIYFDQDRQLIWASSMDHLQFSPGTHSFSHTFPMLPLRHGPYTWLVSIYEDGEQLDAWDSVPEMVVATESHQHQDDRWNGILNVPSCFALDGKAESDY
jgi:hypothetical protein